MDRITAAIRIIETVEAIKKIDYSQTKTTRSAAAFEEELNGKLVHYTNQIKNRIRGGSSIPDLQTEFAGLVRDAFTKNVRDTWNAGLEFVEKYTEKPQVISKDQVDLMQDSINKRSGEFWKTISDLFAVEKLKQYSAFIGPALAAANLARVEFDVIPRMNAIAANTTTGTLGSVTVQVLRENGEIEAIWITERDSKVCPECSPLDGQRFKLDDPGMERPPKHINCRCRLMPVDKRGVFNG